MKKTILSLFMAIGLVLSMVPVQAAEVLVVTWRGKTDAENGFEERLKKLKPGVNFKYIDANRKKGDLAKALRGFDFSSVDLVYSFGTTGSKMVKEILKSQKPQIFNIVSAPKKSKIIQSFEKPGNNLTGVRHIVDIKTQLEVLGKIKDYKSIGVWFDPREKNTTALLDQVNEVAKNSGKTVKKFRVIADAPNFDEMVAQASEASKSVDVVYIPSSSAYIQKADKLLGKLDPSVFVLGAVGKYIGKGATVALAANYKERGESAAELANKVLSGANAGDIPVDIVTTKTARLFVDQSKPSASKLKDLDKLGLTVVKK